MATPTLLNTSEFAAHLGVTTRRARALAASGRVEGAMKIGRDWLIPVPIRISAGTRGPRSRAIAGATRVVLAAHGQGLALKRARQRRFRKRASQWPQFAGGALAFRLPREDLRFQEPDLSSDDLL